MLQEKWEWKHISLGKRKIFLAVYHANKVYWKKCNLIHSFETADLLYSPLWPGRRSTGCVAPWEDSGPEIFLVLYSSALFLGGEQPHFVQCLLPLIWNDLALLCIQDLFWASSKPSCKVQDHYDRQKCSEIAHHCQLITKNPLIADIIINYIPLWQGQLGSLFFLPSIGAPNNAVLLGRKTWMHLEASWEFTWATYADHSSLWASKDTLLLGGDEAAAWKGLRNNPFPIPTCLPHCCGYKSLFPNGPPNSLCPVPCSSPCLGLPQRGPLPGSLPRVFFLKLQAHGRLVLFCFCSWVGHIKCTP